MARSSGESTIGYVMLGLERHVTNSCEPFDRGVTLLVSCRVGGSVAADVGNVKKTCSSNMVQKCILRIVRSDVHVSDFVKKALGQWESIKTRTVETVRDTSCQGKGVRGTIHAAG